MAMGLIRCVSQAGVKRDGTALDGNNYSDATWCRFQRGLPRKIGGYSVVSPYLNGISRALHAQSSNGAQYYVSGHANGLDSLQIDSTGLASLVINRTPSGFTASPNTNWQFDVQYDNATNKTLLFAFAGQSLLTPSNQTNSAIYWGNVYDNTPMVPITPGAGGLTTQVSGGICSLAPYLIIFGNDGLWGWSTPGYPTNFDNSASNPLGALYTGETRVTSQKILRGIPLRGGGGYSPNGLFWSIDSVVRATFTGIPNGTWQWDQLTTQSSLLSDRCVIENDGTFYWAGVDRFLMFNGVIQEIPNEMNLNWFYDGINPAYAGKSFAMKVPRYGEIWWCYPRGMNTECSHAVIYNYREKSWYDTPLPNLGRSSGFHGDTLVGTVATGVTPNKRGLYNLWRHEVGTDEVDGASTSSVPSSFSTNYLSGFSGQPPSNAGITISCLQPDFVQTGDMTVTVLKKNNAKAPEYAGKTATIFADPTDALEQITPLKDTAKIMRLQFTSNTVGGDYQMGQTMMEVGSDGEKDL